MEYKRIKKCPGICWSWSRAFFKKKKKLSSKCRDRLITLFVMSQHTIHLDDVYNNAYGRQQAIENKNKFMHTNTIMR